MPDERFTRLCKLVVKLKLFMSELSISDSSDSLLNWRPVRRKNKRKVNKLINHKRKRPKSLTRQSNRHEPSQKKPKLHSKHKRTHGNERPNVPNKIPKSKVSNKIKQSQRKLNCKATIEPRSKSKLKSQSKSKAKIQNEMTYPGQVKVTVIRETRAVNYAK